VPAGGRQTSSPLLVARRLLVAHALPRDWSPPAGFADGLPPRLAFGRLCNPLELHLGCNPVVGNVLTRHAQRSYRFICRRTA
jgi:hypothetical protein